MEDEEALKEEEVLEQLKLRQREKEEKAMKFKGKGELEDSPLPSPKHLQFPEFFPKDTYSSPIVTEEEIQLRRQQEDKTH